MNAVQHRSVRRFLAQFDRELGMLPATQRETIVDDVEAHIADALDHGRDVRDVLAGLGTPREVAMTYAAELDVPSSADPARRAARWLAVAAIAVGVLSAATIAFSDAGVAGHGFGTTVLLCALPTLLGGVPLVVPGRWGQGAAAAGAVAATAFVAFGLFSVFDASPSLALFAPLMLVLWAAVIVPPVAARMGGVARLIARIFASLLIVLPCAAIAIGVASGALGVNAWALVIAAAIVVAGILFALGSRIAYAAVALAGVVVLVTSLFDAGLLFLAVWTFGGLWIAVGTSALAATRRRSTRRQVRSRGEKGAPSVR